MTNHLRFLVPIVIGPAVGCGRGVPTIWENHKGLPPWESLPEGNGITYIEKFADDPGRDPLYLAKIKYEDDAALKTFIDHFGLIPETSLEVPATWVGMRKQPPSWYPLQHVTQLYVYPEESGPNYAANLWVDGDAHVMILERSWW